MSDEIKEIRKSFKRMNTWLLIPFGTAGIIMFVVYGLVRGFSLPDWFLLIVFLYLLACGIAEWRDLRNMK